MGELYKKGVVSQEEFRDAGTLVQASVPAELQSRCEPLLTEEPFACQPASSSGQAATEDASAH